MKVTILALLLCVLALPAAAQDGKNEGDVARVPGWARFTIAPTDNRQILRKTFAVEVFCDEEHLDLTADYPQFAPNSTANRHINRAIERSVLDDMLDQRFDGCTQYSNHPTEGEYRRTASKDTSCDAKLFTPQFVSIRCLTGGDGGMHPSAWVASLNFDRRKGTVVQSSELFLRSGQPQLERLIRAHLDSVGPRELSEFGSEMVDDVVRGLLTVPWLTRKGVTFEYYWYPEIFVSEVSYAELRELLAPAIRRALQR